MKFTVFLDVLGISNALEQLSDDYDFTAYWNTTEENRSKLVSLTPVQDLNLPETWFRAMAMFPIILAHASSLLKQIDAKSHHFCSVFSDSAFFIFDDIRSAILFASYAMSAAFRAHIPIRGGIGAGNFCSITPDSGKFGSFLDEFKDNDYLRNIVNKEFLHNGTSKGSLMQEKWIWSLVDKYLGKSGKQSFLGSSIARAYRAESCGRKGMRILIDDSVLPTLKSEQLNFILPLKEVEHGHKAKHTYDKVSHELCWLLPLITWKNRCPNSSLDFPTLAIPYEGMEYREKTILTLMQTMGRIYDPKRNFRIQYNVTYSYIDRMRFHIKLLGYETIIPERNEN